MKRPRSAEITYYDWSVTRWLISDTRAALDPAGRYIYRELLDQCYVSGSIPRDEELLARKVECTVEQLRRAWPHIARHFVADKKNKNIWVNVPANMWRKQFFRYLNTQKTNGRSGGRKKGTQNPNGFMTMETSGVSLSERSEANERTNDISERSERTEPTSIADAVGPLDSVRGSLEHIRDCLNWYANELCKLNWPAPDETICKNVFASVQGDMEFLDWKLKSLWKTRKAKPNKNYAWFATVLRKDTAA